MLKSCKIRKCLWHMHKMDKKFYQMFKRRVGGGGEVKGFVNNIKNCRIGILGHP